MKQLKKRIVILLTLILFIFSNRNLINAMNNFEENSEDLFLPKNEEFVSTNFLKNRNLLPIIPMSNNVVYTSKESGKWIWPTDEYYPVICVYLCYDNHHAIDIYAITGTPVYASRDGVVQQVTNSCPSMNKNQKECGGGYGNYITIKHAEGVYSRYAHLDKVYVKNGQKVTAGEKIGTIGTSGRVGAAHLHYEIRQNIKGMKNGGWNPLDSKRFYYILPKEVNAKKVGWEKVNNQWSYYRNGVKQTGWLNLSNEWYYLDSKGIMKTGWQFINNKWYYMNSNGVMKTGWLNLSNEWYYLDSKGIMKTGFQKISGQKYYLDSNGVMKTGWQFINNNWYYFNKDGHMLTNTIIDGWIIDSEGIAIKLENLKNGWVLEAGNWYYFENNNLKLGWQKIDNKWYYFNKFGVMLKNQIIDNWIINSDGVANPLNEFKDGWIKVGEEWYYKKTNLVKGWLKSDNYWYYMDEDGKMISDEWINYKGDKYYINPNGKMVTGWLKYRNQWYYFNKGGDMANSGIKDGWIITNSGMAYLKGEINPDYVVNKSISRLVKLGYKVNYNLNSNNAKRKILTGTAGYEEALTEACVVEVVEGKAKEFNIYTVGNKAYILYK